MKKQFGQTLIFYKKHLIIGLINKNEFLMFFMLAKEISIYKNCYLVNFVSEKLNFSSWLRKKLQRQSKFCNPLLTFLFMCT